MYIVNQDGNQAIKLYSVTYSCYWSKVYERVEQDFAQSYNYEPVFYPYEIKPHKIMEVIEAQCDSWKQEHPYEEIIDIYINGDRKFGTFYSRQRGIEEYENILKALEDGVVVYRIPEINESERENGK